jgi:F420-non-reducing hydrogenase iron-sulfur subunit
VEHTRGLLEAIGLEGQRLQMINISSAMGGQFAFMAAEITAEIERLGPNPLRENGAIKNRAISDREEMPTEQAANEGND